MFRLFECCALSFFERFVLSFSLKIERFVSDSAEIWICGLYIESNAYRLLVEKIEKITAYVEESRNREETERKRKEEAESPAAKGRKADPKWMTHKEVCEMLDISHRTLQRYRQKHIIPYSMIGRQIRYPRQAVESLRERWMVETPAAKIDRMIAEHPLHNRKNGSYGKKGRDTGKNQ